MPLNYVDVKSVLTNKKRYEELNKTDAGKLVLKNIALKSANELASLFHMYPKKKRGDHEHFNNLLGEIVRPNLFNVIIEYDNQVLDCSDLIRSVTLPEIKKEILQYKRAGLTFIRQGRTIIPENKIAMTFYQDVGNKSLGAIFETFQQKHDFKKLDMKVSFIYSAIISENNSSSKIGGQLKNFLLDYLMDATGAESWLNTLSDLFPNFYSNCGNGEAHKEVYDKPLQKYNVLAYTFEDCFFENISTQEYNTERVNSYQEINTNLVFNNPSLYVGEHELNFNKKTLF